MGIEKRIREIRKRFNLNQTEFGKKIGIKQGTVTGYETGVREPSNSVIMMICSEFGVSRQWLETGDGEMFCETSDLDRQMQEIIRGTHDSPAMRSILIAWSQLNDQNKRVLEDFIIRVAKDCLLNEGIGLDNPAPARASGIDEAADDEVSAYFSAKKTEVDAQIN